ncbi:ATP-binding protein [Nocardiopsis sp. MG754419]|uniref:ATP-binding protein n=1 Tax=Nocardiopsis sp. MG754419 TaxID=2259865 RepID=UPI001BAC8F11|nr:ATP-binding protein [Nocardiopsis sp. MG754419]MBR8743518.1 ATP-binding protein [Nocardiopsis sp. MG754419]
MTIVPRSRVPFHTPTPGFEGRRWPSRVYPGDLAQAAWVREDLRADLFRLEGLCPDLAETVILCASEMFANGVGHSLSGQPGGRLVRTLAMPAARTLHLSVVDDGTRSDTPTHPEIPCQRTAAEWAEAERGRGLLIVDALAARWGSRAVVDFPFCAGLGTAVWAEFTLGAPGAPLVPLGPLAAAYP